MILIKVSISRTERKWLLDKKKYEKKYYKPILSVENMNFSLLLEISHIRVVDDEWGTWDAKSLDWYYYEDEFDDEE